MDTPLYETRPRFDALYKWIIGGTLGITLIPGLFLLSSDSETALWLLGLTAFDALLFRAVFPRGFRLYPDRLVILLGGPLKINLSLANIGEVKAVPAGQSGVNWGLQFATATSTTVEIVRRRGLNMVISPEDRDAFIAAVESARRDLPAA